MKVKRRKRMKRKLIIAVDLGASLTKVFYRLLIEGAASIDGLKTYYSAVQRITESRYLAKQYADDNTSLVAYDGDHWMVGSAARHEVAFTNVRAPKQKHAIAKVLAAVGQVLYEYGGEALDGIEVELGVLLPLDEMAGDPTLGNRLGELLFEFGHNGRQVKCVVSGGVSVATEGYGYVQLADKPTAAVLMIGHRDAAYLHIDKGSICPTESLSLPGWGMVKLIKLTNYLFKDELRAAAAIFAAGDTFRDKPLLKLVLPEELPKVKRELKEARSLVWGQLMDELNDTPLRSNEQIFGAGGSGFYWKPELKAEFGAKLSMGGEFLNELQTKFPELDKSPLLPRCVDCARFWLSLPGMVDESPVRSLVA
jgi:hypothetical protein